MPREKAAPRGVSESTAAGDHHERTEEEAEQEEQEAMADLQAGTVAEVEERSGPIMPRMDIQSVHVSFKVTLNTNFNSTSYEEGATFTIEGGDAEGRKRALRNTRDWVFKNVWREAVTQHKLLIAHLGMDIT